VKEAFRRKEHMVNSLQAACRAKVSVRLAIVRREAVEAEELLIIRRATREIFEDRKASRIQALARGRAGRKQAAERADLLRTAEALVLGAVVKLQCFFRRTVARGELLRRQVVAWKAKQKRQLMQEVQNELFAGRAQELATLETTSRGMIHTRERKRTLALLARAAKLGWPVYGIATLPVETYAADTPDMMEAADEAPRRPSAPVSRPSSSALNKPRRPTSTTGRHLAATPSRQARTLDGVEEAESRARNVLLKAEVQLFVNIFVALQIAAPELPISDTPSAAPTPYGMYDVSDEAAGYTFDDTAVAGGSVPQQQHTMVDNDGADFGDLLAVPPDSALGTAADTEPHAATRDAFDSYYDVEEGDEEGASGEDDVGLYDD
jgi:hypothetical protein